MNKKYEIAALDNCKVYFHNPYDFTDLAYYYYLPEDELKYIDQWLQENNLGRREYYSVFQLNGPEELDIFLLKWAK